MAGEARQAALGLSAREQEESPIGALLLGLLVMFSVRGTKQGGGESREQVRMFSRELVAGLNAETDRPWMVSRRGKEVTERWLSQQLAPYGIRPRTIWIGDISAKGYLEEDFKEVFRRYLPKALIKEFLSEQAALHRQAGTAEAAAKGEHSAA